MFDVPKTFRIKNCIILETIIFRAWKKIITSKNFSSTTSGFCFLISSKLTFQGLINLSFNQNNDFQAAMEITTNLQLEGMPDKDKAQVFIQSNDVRTLISNSERRMIDMAMI